MSILQKSLYKIRKKIYRKIISIPWLQRRITDRFHKLYYHFHKRTWSNTYWLNAPAKKCPLDLWVYQEIIYKMRPDLIIETGTAGGGSALFLATICGLVNNGRVVTIDIESNAARPSHDRITYLLGSSTSKEIVEKVKAMAGQSKNVMVILDSDHTKEHVLDELRTYNRFVPKDGYIIVEDSNIHGHPVRRDFPPGPMDAIDAFLRENNDFIVDKEREKFFLTFNPRGYLKRIR